jgi:hypothetical protein
MRKECFHKFHKSGVCVKCNKHWVALEEEGDNPFEHSENEIED